MGTLFKLRSLIYMIRGIGVSFSNRISSGVQISKGVSIGNSTSIKKDSKIIGTVVIGKNCFIGKNTKISGDVIIGDNCKIGDDITINVYLSGKIRIGNRCVIQKGVDMGGNIIIGDSSTVGACSKIMTMPKAQLNVGNDVLINHFSILGASESVEIGDHCIFAPYLHITDAEHSFEDIAVTIKHAPIKSAPVIIQENVWLGSGVIVLMGCNIGKGSVVGAKSLVNKSLPDYSVAFGIPAKIHKSRV